MFQLNGKSAIVTGGAKGIGAAIVTALATAGASVVVADIDEPAAMSLCAQLSEDGLQAVPFIGDVSKSDQANALIEFSVDRFGKLDILCNNAGILRDCGIEDISDNEWRRMMSVNLDSVFYCSRAAIHHMFSRRYGRIINIASAGGKLGFPFAGVHYCSSKGAIMAFTRQLAYQHAKENILVNAIAPGLTTTGMVSQRTPEQYRFIDSKLLTKRRGKPEDSAAVVLFLASDEASYITGETIDVNGALYMS